MKKSRSRSRRGGFTLVEVLLVLVILVVLVSLAVPAYINAQRKAYINAARTEIGMFETALDMYHLDLSVFPTTEEGLSALRQPPASLGNPDKWNGPYLKKAIPLDPWGRPYQYECNGAEYKIFSAGDGSTGEINNLGEE